MNTRRMSYSKKRSRGVTLVELVIAIITSSMVFLAVSNTINILFSSNSRVLQLDVVEQTKNDLIAELTTSIKWASVIKLPSEDDPNHIIVDDTIYRLDNSDGRMYKNNVALTPQNVTITKFSAEDLSVTDGDNDPKSYAITFEMVHKQFPAITDHIRIVVSQRLSSTSI